MTFDSILQNITKNASLNREESDYFTSLLQYKELEKQTHLLKEGQACTVINYVHSGALRAYCLDNKGKEVTIMFAVNDWWITDMYCFVNRTPAMMFIETIEKSTIFQLRRENLEALYVKVPKFERVFRILMQNAYTREQLRTIENLSMTAEERYERFIKKYPQIIPHLTQKQIASYLGVTPEFLSVIRRQKAKSNIS